MATPEDPTGPEPNQLSQPGAVPPTDPGWAAVPPTQPGWGAPPAGYQPGLGAPPPQQTWGAPPPGPNQYWNQPKWAAEPERTSHTKRNGCLIGCGVAVLAGIAIIVVLAVVLLQAFGPALDVSMKIQQNSNGQVSGTSYNWVNGVDEFRIQLAAGVTPSEGRAVACNVVRPTLKGTKFEGTKFVIVSDHGLVVADQTTTCDTP